MARPTGPRLSEALAEYRQWQTHRGRSEGTLIADKNVLHRFMDMTGDILVKNIRPEHVNKFMYLKRETPLKPATHNSYRSRFQVFFRWCHQRRYLTNAEALMADIEIQKIPTKNRQKPAPNQLLSLLDHAPNARDRVLLALSMNTGLRASELVALRIGDVDLDAGTLDVRIQKTKDEDELPITADLDHELRRWFIAYAENLGRPLHGADLLLPTNVGGVWTHYDHETKQMVRGPIKYDPEHPVQHTEMIVQRALKAVGLPTYYEGTHTLRRAVALAYYTAASAEKGDVAALRETSALLHHKNVATTERYLGLTAEKARRDRRLRGQPFLTAMVDQTNVVPLRRAQAGE